MLNFTTTRKRGLYRIGEKCFFTKAWDAECESEDMIAHELEEPKTSKN